MFAALLIIAAILGSLWVIGKLTSNPLGSDIVVAVALVLALLAILGRYAGHWW
jgi:hypothetical protein